MMSSPEDMSGWSSGLPASSAKCKRADILPGSCIRLQPLAPSSSKLRLCKNMIHRRLKKGSGVGRGAFRGGSLAGGGGGGEGGGGGGAGGVGGGEGVVEFPWHATEAQ